MWALLAVVLSCTLRTRVHDRSAVEHDVAAQFEEHEGVAIRLACTDSMALTTGGDPPLPGHHGHR